VADGQAVTRKEPAAESLGIAGESLVGSPFAEAPGPEGGAATGSVAPRGEHFGRALVLPAYPRHSAAAGGAIASVVLGLLSGFWAAITPSGAIVTSLLGLAMGAWGLLGRRRRTALAGLLLCCIALGVSSYLAAISLREAIRGANPWAPGPAAGETFNGP
jgi:hypothetical protein